MSDAASLDPESRDLDAACQALITAGQILEHQGQGDFTRGHVSIRVPGRPEHFIMKPHSVGLDEITRENIVTFDLDGVLVAGTARPHSERYIHSEILRARPDLNAVIHAHPTHLIAFSSTGQEMRALSQGGAVFEGRLPMFTDTMDLIRSQETGRAVAMRLGPHNAVVMRGHGVAIAGEDVKEAVVLCLMLEEAARIQLLASASGLDAWSFPPEDVAALRDKLTRPDQFAINFDYLARKARKALGSPEVVRPVKNASGY